MRQMLSTGLKVQMCVTSPPYFGLRDYGVEGQLGIEPTVDKYVDNLVEVFRLVRDLLADDGTLWLNLGDSYNGVGRGEKANGLQIAARATKQRTIQDLKPKDLIGIPWRVAFALQADGWFLRQDIIWHKPNPMPESVTDRCTKAHEYLFLLAKSERYYYDAAAIAEEATGRSCGNRNYKYDGIVGMETKQGVLKVADVEWQERNRRSVWTIATNPYSEAHFAIFPPALIEPCIMAGSRVGDTILDPFFGSGTTGQVAQNLGRKWIGCELNPEYVKLQQKRTAQQAMVLA
jgi:DNA modification methylase